jgi:hypothetical protein
MVDVELRRALRHCVSKALKDVGYTAPAYRHDGSAGSTVALVATQERPSLTASVFLEAVDYEFAQATSPLRFLGRLAGGGSGVVGGSGPGSEAAIQRAWICASSDLRSDPGMVSTRAATRTCRSPHAGRRLLVKASCTRLLLATPVPSLSARSRVDGSPAL